MSTGTRLDRLAMLADLGLRWQPTGQAGLCGPLLGLADECDRAFARLAAMWEAREERHPASLPARVLQRVDYLRSFPQQATFPVRLDPAEANLDAFVGGDIVDGSGEVALTRLAGADDVLTPAACYHVYPAHEGERLASPLYVTTRNTCFRQETSYVPLRRMRSFTMREIICIATETETARFVASAQDVIGRFAAVIDVPVAWQAATDCFFRPERNPKYLFQRLEPVKREATYGGDLAIASVNLHHDHFGAVFGLTRHGVPATTACAAFGLERWLWAIVDRHGADPSSWPRVADAAETVRDQLAQERR
jgi:seryl-tRNA synthetase